MTIVLSLVLSFLLLRLTFTLAAPHYDLTVKDRALSGCNIPSSRYVSCNNGMVTFNTGQGSISGSITSAGAIRFTVKYATAQRFKPPQISSTSSSNFANSTSLPPLCPQSWVDPSTYSEDCLYFVAYVPSNATPVSYSGGARTGAGGGYGATTGDSTTNQYGSATVFPVVVWVHGGSYSSGSASDPVLDGSKLAEATGSVVVVIQYRLGVLGYLPPASLSANKNLGVQDVMTALKYIQNVIGCVGGDKTKIVLAGQSSGGNMIRNLLATPSASSLFSRAIIQSDPMDYGFLGISTFTKLQSAFYGDASCGSCLTTPVSSLLAIQDTIVGAATSIDPAAGPAEPIRPVLDGSLIQYSLTTTFPPTSKNILLTTVKDEAGPATYASIGSPLLPAYFNYVAGEIYGPARAVEVEAFYQVAEDDTDDIRPQLVFIGTDGAWRCPNYAFARSWAARGGNVWVGEFTVGATYPANAAISFCTTDGAVCHQDDIPIVFGTTTSPTAAQTALTAQVQARWAAFINTGNPNTSGFGNWSQVTHDGSIPVLNLGGTDPIPLGGCIPSAWGGSIPFDYQIYDQ